MAAQGSLTTLGVVELLQIAALFRKMGSLRLVFGNGRTIIVYFQDSYLSGLTDSGRVWQLGDLLEQLGRVGVDEKRRLLGDVEGPRQAIGPTPARGGLRLAQGDGGACCGG